MSTQCFAINNLLAAVAVVDVVRTINWVQTNLEPRVKPKEFLFETFFILYNFHAIVTCRFLFFSFFRDLYGIEKSFYIKQWF